MMWNYYKYLAIDDFFDTLSTDPAKQAKTLKSEKLHLLSDKDGTATWTLDLPGVKKADLSVTQDADAVRISGKRGDLKFDNKYLLPEEYDINSASAMLEDGVLYLTVSRRALPTKIRNILQ